MDQSTTRRGGGAPPKRPRPPPGQAVPSRALVKREPRKVDLSLGRARNGRGRRGRGPRWPVLLAVLAALVLLPVAGAGALYLRLLQGPIDAGFLVGPVERAINEEIAPLRAQIAGAAVRYDGHSVRFRLEDVRIYDEGDALVALAPHAAIRLSGRALLRGRIAPASIDLIEPALLLTYSSEEGLVIRASEPDAEGAGEVEPGGADKGRSISLARTAAETLSEARQSSVSSYLSRLGLTDARLVFDHAGRRKTWKIPRLALRLDHHQKRSAITADGELLSRSGPVSFGITLEQSEKTRRLGLVASLDGLVPADLTESLPQIAGLAVLGMPISGDVRIELGESGDVVAADADLTMGAGPVLLASLGAEPLALESGEISAHYSAEDGYIQIRPSRLKTSSSQATLEGIAVPRKAGPDLSVWDFKLALKDAAAGDIGAGLAALPIDDWTIKGSFVPQSGLLAIDHMQVKAGGGGIVLAARASADSGVRCKAMIKALPTDYVTRLWPASLGPSARKWVVANLRGGRVTEGSFSVDLARADLDRIEAGLPLPPEALTGELRTEGVGVTYLEGLPELSTTTALIKLEGTRFLASVEGGAADLGGGRTIALKSGSFEIGQILAEPAVGEAAFEVAGDVPSIMDFLDRPPLGYIREIGLEPGTVAGSGSGSFTLKVPLIERVRFRDVELNGEAKLRELTAKSGVGPFPLDGGSIDVAISPKSIDAKGDLIVSGVSADLRFARFLGPGSAKQPPLRVSATLDAADRQQLGIEVNHFLFGDLPVTISVESGAPGGRRVFVQADLTGAELVLDNMAWRKPPGEAATLEFRIDDSKADEIELEDFRIYGRGSDIAISGRISLDARHRLVAFDFPDFSMNLLTQMRVSGVLDKSRVWQVKAIATTYDGRPFFRSLFSAGRISDKAPESMRGTSAGIDLEAEIKTMVGFSDTSVQDVKLSLKRRDGLLAALEADGDLAAGKSIKVRLERTAAGARELIATTDDAGSAFRLVNFYRNAEGGAATLRVNLEGSGGADKTGILRTNNFIVATSDAVVSEMISEAGKRAKRKRVETGQGQSTGYYFQQLRVPFSVGRGRLVLHDAQINGPALGATISGTVDFENQWVALAGDYFPLYGVNSIAQPVPLLGELFAGKSGEATFGLSYKISGRLASPNVAINPISALFPGQLRKIFSFEAPDGPIPPAPEPDAAVPPSLASSSPPVSGEEAEAQAGQTSVGEALPAMVDGSRPAQREDASRAASTPRKKRTTGDTLDGWTSEMER